MNTKLNDNIRERKKYILKKFHFLKFMILSEISAESNWSLDYLISSFIREIVVPRDQEKDECFCFAKKLALRDSEIVMALL